MLFFFPNSLLHCCQQFSVWIQVTRVAPSSWQVSTWRWITAKLSSRYQLVRASVRLSPGEKPFHWLIYLFYSLCQGSLTTSPPPSVYLCLPVMSALSGVVLHGHLQVEHECRCCQELAVVRRSVTLQCSDLTTRQYDYRHIASCGCRACGILR